MQKTSDTTAVVSAGRRAFSLVETVIGMTVFSIAATGILALLIQSYRTTMHARCVDQARAALRTVASEFLQGDDSDAPLFAPTAAPTGSGLRIDGIEGDNNGLRLTIGNNTPAVVLREVVQVAGTTGQPVAGVTDDLAGRVMQGTFLIRYTYDGRLQEERLTLLRALP